MAKPSSAARSVAPEAAPAPSWLRWLIRVRAYFRKEVNELRRQPMLILSLIIGPLLVLLVFGATFTNSTPHLRTGLVLPPDGLASLSEERLRALAGTNFDLQLITTDRALAETQLANGELDVIQVLPAGLDAALRSGVSPQIEFRSNAINPLTEGWVQYLAYAEVNEINKALLRSLTEQAQQEAAAARVRVTDAEGQVRELEAGVSEAQAAEIQTKLEQLIVLLDVLERRLPPQELLAAQGSELAELRPLLLRLRGNLSAIEQALAAGALEEVQADLEAARLDLGLLGSTLELFVGLSPDTLISPVTQRYSNIRNTTYSAVVYYAPGVLALLVQHTAITLGALALVRERLMGAFELFRVAPVSMSQLLLGKYLGYTLFIGLAAAVLIVAMRLLGVPLLGSWWQFGLLILMLTIASLGVGFLISALSNSDSQAIQLAMISLLLSIFFSGFFISLDSFAPPALLVSYSLPMSHGVLGLQYLMLRGLPVPLLAWVGLAAISVVSFALVVLVTRRQFQRA